MAKYDLMFISAITPLHNGSGISLGLVDNPVIRERHTQFPIIQSTSVKGALRDKFGQDTDVEVQALFGPPVKKGDSHGGAISFTDAQVFAFPVRSLKGAFVWATSPLALNRLWKSIVLAELEAGFETLDLLIKSIGPTFNNNSNNIKVCPSGKAGLEISGKVILEEFPKTPVDTGELENFAKDISPTLFDPTQEYLISEFQKKLVILTEDSFRYFLMNATEVMPNIHIGENGTTETGSLRYTEFLPSETILYTFITYNKARKPKNNTLCQSFEQFPVNGAQKNLIADDGDVSIQNLFRSGRPAVLQIGGDETTGKGLVQLRLMGGC